MQRIAFTMRIKPGTEEEYRRRHWQVWPELLVDLKRYLEIMAASRASERWEAQMSDILIREPEAATGFPPVLEEVFHLD